MGAHFYVTLTATVQVSDDALLHDKLQGTVDYGQIVEVLHRVAVDGVCIAEAQVILVATLGNEVVYTTLTILIARIPVLHS